MDIDILATVLGTILAGVAVYIAYLQLRRTPEPARIEHEPPKELPRPQPPPRRVSHFVERHTRQGLDLVSAIKENLRQTGMISLWGSGGVGKTTLAIEICHQLLADFDGVIWIGLETYDDFSLAKLLNEICIQLNREDAITLATDTKRSLVVSLLNQGNYLLVIDSFENVRDKEPILAFLGQARCSILITTREYIARTRNIEIPQMTEVEAEKFVHLLLQEIELARLVDVEIGNVVEVAERNPLLIQWIVSQLEVASHPNEVFSDLQAGKGEAAQRVFGRSFSLLSHSAQQQLLSLSLFRTGARRKILAQVCGAETEHESSSATFELRRLKLIDRSQPLETITLTGLTRNLVEAQMQVDPRAGRLRSNYINVFLELVESHSGEKAADVAVLEEERENIIGAMEQANQLGQWPEIIRFWDAVSGFLWTRGYWDDYITCDQLSLRAAQNIGDRRVIATVLSELGWVNLERADYSHAMQLIKDAKTIFQELGDHEHVCITLAYLTVGELRQGNLNEAEAYCRLALEIAERHHLSQQMGTLKNYLGSIYRDRKDYQAAREQFNAAIEIFANTNDTRHLIAVLRNLGALEFELGNLVQARSYYEKALEFAIQEGQTDMIAGLYLKLAELAKSEGQTGLALDLARQSEQMFYRLRKSKDREKAQTLIADLT